MDPSAALVWKRKSSQEFVGHNFAPFVNEDLKSCTTKGPALLPLFRVRATFWEEMNVLRLICRQIYPFREYMKHRLYEIVDHLPL